MSLRLWCVDGVEGDGGYVEALENLRDALRADAARETTLAMVAIVKRAQGFNATEIREQLGLSAGEMRSVSLRLEKAARSLRAGL